tara:strand:+ start:132 stop:425 length:294 start_codon:yes stop_codon:yes gene_type:complete
MSGILFLLAILAIIFGFLEQMWESAQEEEWLTIILGWGLFYYILHLIFPDGGTYINVFALVVVTYCVLRSIVEFIGFNNIIELFGFIIIGLLIASFV